MKSVLFFALICIIGIILWIEGRKYIGIEPFQDKPAGSSPALNVPKANPDPSVLYPGSPQGYMPPTTALLSPPPGQTASVNSYPYEDPALKKASLKQIKGVFESLNGFMVNEEPGLNRLGDPSVTLPLGTSRADRQRLEDELNVLSRNPGLQSSLTLKDMNEIQANLGYLQKKWRLSANSLSVEGFQSGSTEAATDDLKDKYFGHKTTNYFSNQITEAAVKKTTGGSSKTPATIAELRDLLKRIGDEITKLNASSSSDPVLTSRVDNLVRDVKIIESIIKKVTVTKTMKESDITISKAMYYSFLSSLDDVNSILPDIGADDEGGGGSGNKKGSNFLSSLFSDLSGMDLSGVLDNLSFDLNLHYTAENDYKLAEDLVNNAGITQAARGLNNPGNADDAPKTGYRGALDSIIRMLTGAGGGTLNPVDTGKSGSGTESGGSESGSSVGETGGFAWKERATFICDQIVKRDLNPNDYGCLQDTASVSENFSYRGYAKMICSRLATNYDPGIPELCGCPPPEWPGWRQ